MRLIRFIAAWCALFSGGGLSAALVTLTNLNVLYFKVDADPTAVVTNVVLLNGNLTNWFKLSTNVIIVVNPTSTYVPYNNAGAFDDSWFYRISTGIGIDTNLYFGPGITNYFARQDRQLVLVNSGGFTDWAGLSLSNSIANVGGLYAYGNTLHLKSTNALSLYWVGLSQRNLLFLDNWILPDNPNMALGGPDGVDYMPFYEANLTTLNVWGQNPDAGSHVNYSGLSLYHTGTNGAAIFNSLANGTAGSARPFVFEIGTTTNAFRISETMWDDSMVPEALVRVGATAPTQASFNGGPGQTLQFQNNRDDAVMASVQISHRYKQGTSVYPHVHWAETATTGAGTNVVWELQYTWANPDTGVFPPYNTLLMTNNVSGTNWLHSMESFPAISGTGKQVSAVMVFQLRRLANSATADDYDQNVAFLGFDLHYQVDSPGSDSAISKSF